MRPAACWPSRPRRALTQPPADLSAMDGYAVRAEDVPAVPDDADAGRPGAGRRLLRPRAEARRDRAHLHRRAAADGRRCDRDPGRHQGATATGSPSSRRRASAATSARPGSTSAAGDRPFAAGRTLTTRDVALAAAMNLPWLSVHRKPRVAILSTGDELVMPGEPVGRNQIVSSSGIARGGPGARLGRRAHPVRHRARRRQADRRTASPPARSTTSWSPWAAPRSATTTWCRPRSRPQGFDDGFLAHRHAPGKAADVRRQGPRPRARPAGQSGLDHGLRAAVPEARAGAHAGPARRPRRHPAGAAGRRRQGERHCARTMSAPSSTRAADGGLTVEPHPVQDSSMLSVLAWSLGPADPAAARPGPQGRRHRAGHRSFCSPRRLLIPRHPRPSPSPSGKLDR